MKNLKNFIEKHTQKINKITLSNFALKSSGQTVQRINNTEDWDQYLLNSHLVGPSGTHSRENILKKVERFVDKQKRGETDKYKLNLPTLECREILDMIEKICGISNDFEYTERHEWVSLEVFKKAMLHATEIVMQVMQKSGKILIATGYSQSLLTTYTYIAKCLEKQGADINSPSIYSVYSAEKGQWFGGICGDTTVFKSTCVKYAHYDHILYETILEKGGRPDLVIGDHGMAGAAIRAGIPTVVILDIDDIEFIATSCIYGDRVFPIPMHKSAGINSNIALAHYFEHLILL